MTTYEKVTRGVSAVSAVVVAFALAAMLITGLQNVAPEAPIARATVPCYTATGGQSVVAGSGCTWNVQSGATFQVDSGATETHAGTTSYTGLLNANAGIAVDTNAFTVADASGNTQISGTLGVTSATTLAALVNANGGIAVDTSAFTVADGTGNTVISGTLSVTGTSDLKGNVADSGGDFTVADNAVVTGTANIQGVATVAGLVVGSETQSGAVRFGTASTVISGTLIAHGFSVTPTVFLLQPAYLLPETYTQTIYSSSCNVTSCTVGISLGDVVTYTTVQWMAGK